MGEWWRIAAEWLAPWAPVFARSLGLAWTAPGWGTSGLGWRVRVGLALLITAAVAPAVQANIAPADLPLVAPIEMAVGAMLGLSASLVLAGARQAGELVGVQAGLSPAAFLDPDAPDGMNPLGHLYGWMAVGAFLAMDGPVALVGSLIESYRAIPPGALELTRETIDAVFVRVGWALGLALRAAAPAGVALIAAGAALGMLGRSAPSLSLLRDALPIRVAVGLIVAVAGLAGVVGVFASAWSELGFLASR